MSADELDLILAMQLDGVTLEEYIVEMSERLAKESDFIGHG